MLSKEQIEQCYGKTKNLNKMIEMLGIQDEIDISKFYNSRFYDVNDLRKYLYEKYEIEKEDGYYFNIKDPRTGYRFDIPMLIPTDPDYFEKYVSKMRLREISPETFEKIMNWD